MRHIFIQIRVALVHPPTYSPVLHLIRVVEAAEPSRSHSLLPLRLRNQGILRASAHFEHVLSVLSNAGVDKLASMEFLIDPNRMTLRRSWIVWAIAGKSMMLVELLRR